MYAMLFCRFALPKLGGNNRMNSGRSSASSAKQLYMSKSRYMPGMLTPHHNTAYMDYMDLAVRCSRKAV